MSAFDTARPTQAGNAQDGNVLANALHSALGAALLPARLAGRALEAGWGVAASAVGASERTVSGLIGALVGAAWGAATGGTELFVMSLHKLLEHTPARVQGMLPPRLLGGAEDGGGGGAELRAPRGEVEEAQAVGLGGGYTLNVASAEAAPEEPTPQAEPAAEREAEVAALAAKGGQFVEKAEPGIGAAAPREPVTPARAPAFAPLSPERPGLAAAPPEVDLLPGAGALGAEPRSPVAKIDAHMRAVQEFRAKTAAILKAEEALSGAEAEAGAGAAAPATAGTVGAALLAAEPRLTRRSPVPLERMPSDLTGQEGRPQPPGLEVLHEGPEGTSAEGSAHAGSKRSASIPLEMAAAGAGAGLVPEKFEALEGPYGRRLFKPSPVYAGEGPALPPEAIAAVDLGESEEEGEGPPPLASPSPAGELEEEQEEEAEQAAVPNGGPAAGGPAQPEAAGEAPPEGGEAAPAEGPLETAEARLRGLFAPVGAAAGAVGGFVGSGLAMAGAAAGGAAGAVAEALHVPGLSRAGPEEPSVGAAPSAEAEAAEAGAAEAAPAPEMQPPLAPAGAAAVETEEGVAPPAAAAAETGEQGPTAAAEEAAAAAAAAVPAAAVPPEWVPGSAALLAGRSGQRVAVKRVELPGLGRSVTLESRIVSEEKVASEVAAAQKRRILEGAPTAAGAAAAAAAPAAAVRAGAPAVPITPTEPVSPALGAEAAEAGVEPESAAPLPAEREAPPAAAAAQLAAGEEAAVERRSEEAGAVAGEELGAAMVEEGPGAAETPERKAPAMAEAARPSPFDASAAAAGPAATAEPAAGEAAAAPAVAEEPAAAEKPVAVAAEEPAVAAPTTPAKVPTAAASKPEILPSPAAAAATPSGPAAPKTKKRNPIHKIQKMMGLKPYSTPRP